MCMWMNVVIKEVEYCCVFHTGVYLFGCDMVPFVLCPDRTTFTYSSWASQVSHHDLLQHANLEFPRACCFPRHRPFCPRALRWQPQPDGGVSWSQQPIQDERARTNSGPNPRRLHGTLPRAHARLPPEHGEEREPRDSGAATGRRRSCATGVLLHERVVCAHVLAPARHRLPQGEGAGQPQHVPPWRFQDGELDGGPEPPGARRELLVKTAARPTWKGADGWPSDGGNPGESHACCAACRRACGHGGRRTAQGCLWCGGVSCLILCDWGASLVRNLHHHLGQ